LNDISDIDKSKKKPEFSDFLKDFEYWDENLKVDNIIFRNLKAESK
jgi:hypothetical protein